MLACFRHVALCEIRGRPQGRARGATRCCRCSVLPRPRPLEGRISRQGKLLVPVLTGLRGGGDSGPQQPPVGPSSPGPALHLFRHGTSDAFEVDARIAGRDHEFAGGKRLWAGVSLTARFLRASTSFDGRLTGRLLGGIGGKGSHPQFAGR